MIATQMAYPSKVETLVSEHFVLVFVLNYRSDTLYCPTQIKRSGGREFRPTLRARYKKCVSDGSFVCGFDQLGYYHATMTSTVATNDATNFAVLTRFDWIWCVCSCEEVSTATIHRIQ